MLSLNQEIKISDKGNHLSIYGKISIMKYPINKLLLATNNSGKIKEMRALFEGVNFPLLTPKEIGLEIEVEENGSSYAENAAIKSQTLAKISGLPTLADDSGLEVYVLEGKPGIHSARFHPNPNATDADRRAYLLQQLQNHPQPWEAKFICVLCLALPQSEPLFTQGECHGIIIPFERGSHGFGYDSIFFIPHLSKTMAELTMAEKNQISHRAQAVRSARTLWFS